MNPSINQGGGKLCWTCWGIVIFNQSTNQSINRSSGCTLDWIKIFSFILPAKAPLAYANAYKLGSLATLTFQNVVTVLLIRYAKTLPGEVFISSTVVVLMECFKFIVSLLIMLIQHGSVARWAKDLHEEIIKKPVETLKVAVPAFIYTFQNNLTFVAVSNLDAATFQVWTTRKKRKTGALFQEWGGGTFNIFQVVRMDILCLVMWFLVLCVVVGGVAD